MLHILFVLHNHQPLGNLPDVFRRAYDTSYKPFLDIVRKYPGIKWALHTSGCLWEWLEKEEPGYLEILREEHAGGRLEFLTGAMWEPIQSIISEESFHKQYDLLRKYLGSKFGVDPVGAWTTERVWEPSLAGRLSDQGIQYTLLDDSQLRASLPPKSEHQVWGYYQTEFNGKSVNIFPINEKLRYMIPFSQVDEVIEHLQRLSKELPDGAAITYGDDGEKFGLWPETFDWVYGSGWLDNFLSRLENTPGITTILPSEYMKLQPLPRKRVYIPTSSYREMGVWSLYPKRSLAADKVHHLIESDDELRELEPPHSAGLFRNFLAKYPEGRFMHERVHEIIETILEKAGPDTEPSIDEGASNTQKALWHALRAQCNCPYWHGVFGGIYLNYLRFANNREILHAEGYLREYLDSYVRKIGTVHINNDSGEKVRDNDSIILMCANPQVQWAIDPVTGQVISAASVEKKVDVIDVIARRFEAYHATMKDSSEPEHGDQPASIHNITEIPPVGWKEDFGYDLTRRGCFGDFLSTQSDFSLLLSPADGPWKIENSTDTRLKLVRADSNFIRVKEFVLSGSQPELQMTLSLTPSSNTENFPEGFLTLSLEFNIGLLAGNAADRFMKFSDDKHYPLESHITGIDSSQAELIDEWSGVRIRINVPGAELSAYPVKTLSRGEGGLELNYQGACVQFLTQPELKKNEAYIFKSSMAIYPI